MNGEETTELRNSIREMSKRLEGRRGTYLFDRESTTLVAEALLLILSAAYASLGECRMTTPYASIPR
jgi:hypothetical protein